MPEVIIKFNLPEEQDEFNTYNNAYKYWKCLNDLRQLFRNKLKYQSEEMSDIEFAVIEKISEEFNDILIDNTINLDE